MKKSECVAHIKKVNNIWKDKYRYKDIAPSEPCHKCGKTYWTDGEEPFTWTCLCCGNTIYFTLGAFYQQVDTLLRSQRKDDYVYAEDSAKILPRKNNDLKNIRFKKQVKS